MKKIDDPILLFARAIYYIENILLGTYTIADITNLLADYNCLMDVLRTFIDHCDDITNKNTNK